jgi:hypothetical protein
MSLTIELMKRRIDFLALIGGFVILLDSVWGGMAAAWLDWNRVNELALGISFVLGAPIYLLDLWMDKRIAISMLGLFFFRWIATWFAGPTPVLCSPWRGNVLFILAFVLLQLSKLRQLRKTRQAAVR